MKKIFVPTILSFLLFASIAQAGSGLPLTLSNITLGDDIDKYAECCNMSFATPMPDAPFLTEVHLRSNYLDGIRGGSLTFGNCDKPNKLVRIKLKFHDRSQKLFNKLLDMYTETFGKPESYEGDVFRNVIAWRWNFTHDGEQASLLLMWSRDNELRPGVSIKMSYDSQINREYETFKTKYNSGESHHTGMKHITNINDFIPR
jgi:hypothetical protein